MKKGQKESREHVEMRTASLRGRKRPPEVIKKMSESRKGIWHTEEARQKMSLAQKGKKRSTNTLDPNGEECEICGQRFKKLNRDHDHKSGQPRGKLCLGCNTSLGRFNDDPAILQKAITYLYHWRTR